MRELKFRIWNNEEKIMIENKDIYAIDFRSDIYFSSVMVDDFILNEDDYKLMQYTGVKDKNGKEIYEGDIVQIYYTEHDKFGSGKYTVMYTEDAEWALDDYYLLSVKYRYCKVIGNVYENKDLLK